MHEYSKDISGSEDTVVSIPEEPQVKKVPQVKFVGYNGSHCFPGVEEFSTTELREVDLTPLEDCLAEESDVDLDQFQCCVSWSYSAFGVGKHMVVFGTFIENKLFAKFQFNCNIKHVDMNDHFILILLENGDMIKYEPKTDTATPLSFVELHLDGGPSKQMKTGDKQKIENIEDIRHIAVAKSYSIGITCLNNLYNIPDKVCTMPKRIRVKKLICGYEHSLILDFNGDLYAFGSSMKGQLGVGEIVMEERPVQVIALEGIKVIDIGAGAWHSAAVTSFGDLYLWGWNVDGQLGRSQHSIETKEFRNNKIVSRTGNPSVYTSPMMVCVDPNHQNRSSKNDEYDVDDDGKDLVIRTVSCGARHTVVTTACGKFFATGWNLHGQLGTKLKKGEMSCCDFIRVFEDLDANDWRVVCGKWSTVLIKTLR